MSPRTDKPRRNKAAPPEPRPAAAATSALAATVTPSLSAGQASRRASRVIVVALLFAAAYLGLKGLDNAVFWDDEAQVGIIAKNFLETGELTGWDGRHLYAYRNGTVLDQNLKIKNPPLMFYACAASFKLFGSTTWAGRFPFAVAGLLTLAVFALLLRQDFAPGPWLWLYALGSLALSTAFLLNIRQCRYYSLCLLFSVTAYYAYRRYLASRRARDLALLTASAVLLFYAHYLLCAAFLAAVGVVHFAFHLRALTRRQWLALVGAAAVFLAATLPYTLAARIWDRPDVAATDPWLKLHLTLLWWNFRDLNLMGALPWTVTLGLALLIPWKLRKNPQDREARRAAEWAVLSAANVFFIALTSPQPLNVNPIADLRYLILAIPFLAGLAGLVLCWLHRASRPAALAAFALIVLTNLPSWDPRIGEFRWMLPGFIREIHHDYPTANGEAVRFINAHVKPGELVAATPEFTAYPAMFYTGDRVQFACTLDGQSPLAAIRFKLGVPLLLENAFPHWVIAFGMVDPDNQVLLDFLSRPHEENGRTVSYTYQPFQMLDVYCDDTLRPELPWHLFAPKRDFSRQDQAVYVFKRAEVRATIP